MKVADIKQTKSLKISTKGAILNIEVALYDLNGMKEKEVKQ
jgi:hypothetical protein